MAITYSNSSAADACADADADADADDCADASAYADAEACADASAYADACAEASADACADVSAYADAASLVLMLTFLLLYTYCRRFRTDVDSPQQNNSIRSTSCNRQPSQKTGLSHSESVNQPAILGESTLAGTLRFLLQDPSI